MLVAATAPHAMVAEQYRALRTRLAFSESGHPRRVLLVSSPTKGDGKSITAANLVMEDMRYLQEEHYRVLFLDTRHQVITQRDISIGSLNSSIVHPRETFKAAISHASAAIILVHNHPSGDPKPSPEDITLTARMKDAGELIGIPVLDHLIIGDGRFISLKERGLL
jgi:DNA repair protein RadC